jgi:hypothetical protein
LKSAFAFTFAFTFAVSITSHLWPFKYLVSGLLVMVAHTSKPT